MKIKKNMTHLWYGNQIRRPLSKRERKMDSSNLERSFDSLVDLLPQFHSALSMCKFVERKALRNHTFSRLCLLSGNHMYLSLHDVILGVDKFYFIFQFSANYFYFVTILALIFVTELRPRKSFSWRFGLFQVSRSLSYSPFMNNFLAVPRYTLCDNKFCVKSI